jgi:hypothetical protein
MSHSDRLLALATPSLILLGVLGVLLRQGSDRLQAIPPVVIGVSLLVQRIWSQRRRRRALLRALREQHPGADRGSSGSS